MYFSSAFYICFWALQSYAMIFSWPPSVQYLKNYNSQKMLQVRLPEIFSTKSGLPFWIVVHVQQVYRFMNIHINTVLIGATFMAAGSSAPELFSSLVSLTNKHASNEIGIGTIVGSAVFNILAIIGVTAIFAGRTLHLDWKPLSRDAVFYTAAVLGIVLIFLDSKIYW